LETARINLRRTRLSAPCDGIISRKSAEVGQQVAARSVHAHHAVIGVGHEDPAETIDRHARRVARQRPGVGSLQTGIPALEAVVLEVGDVHRPVWAKAEPHGLLQLAKLSAGRANCANQRSGG